MNKRNRLLSKFSTLLKLALPLMLTNFIQTLYNLTDSYFLGKLGKESVSAPILSFHISYFLIALGMGFSVGGTTLISQSKGKKDLEKMNLYLGQTTLFLALLSGIITAAGLLFTDPLLTLLKTPAEVHHYALEYLLILFKGIPFMFTAFLFTAAMQGAGNTFTPLLIQIITVGINVLLDPLLIFGIGGFPRLEVRGAAIATVIARGIAAVICIIILINGKKGYSLKLKYLIPNKRILSMLIKIGLPVAFGQSVTALGFTVLQGAVNHFGTAVIAAFGIGNRITALFNMPCLGISRATAILVGQYLGAKQVEEAKETAKAAFIIILLFIIPCMIFIFFCGHYVIRFFVNDEVTIMWGARLFKFISVSVTFFAIMSAIQGIFEGSGDTKPAMFLNIARLWGIRVPLAYFLSIGINLGPDGLWTSLVISNFVTLVLFVIKFKKDTWHYAINVNEL